MTVRDYLNKKIVRVYIIMLICFVLFAVLIIFERPAGLTALLPITPFIGFVACIVYLNFGIRCPDCKNPVAYLSFMSFGGYFCISKKIRFCPFCGIEMDLDIDQKELRQ